MSNSSRMTYSVHGRELGIERLSSVQLGSSNPCGVVVGVEDVRQGIQTATTSVVLPPFGLSVLSTGSSAVHTLGAPIPGVRKYIYSSGGATAYVNTQNANIISSVGSTQATLGFLNRGVVEMIGLTTALWGLMGNTTGSGVNVAAST